MPRFVDGAQVREMGAEPLQEVARGLRPEAVHVIKAGGGGASRLTGTVVSRSYLGATTRLAITLNGMLLHATMPPADDVPVEGDQVTIGFAKDALHLMEDEA